MSPEAHLLRAALDADDDTPGLILADCCEEFGVTVAQRARGEFLRIQIELARWVPDLDRRTLLQQREAALLAAHATEWLGGPRMPWHSWRFERGLAHVRMTAGKFAASRTADWLRRAWVQSVRLDNVRSRMLAVAQTAHLGDLTSLDLDTADLNDELLGVLLASPHLGGLRSLNLANNALTDECLRQLAESADALPSLTSLDLRNNRLSQFGLKRLVESPLGRRLSRLDVQGNVLTSPDQLIAFVRRPGRIVNSVGMELALIPAGSFLMGSPESEPGRFDNEGPQHRVTLTRPFYISVYPMTAGQGIQASSDFLHGPSVEDYVMEYPLDSLNWEEAVDFCDRLSRLPEEQAAGRTYRLPTEAEWEYACRAGTTTPYHFGTAITRANALFNEDEFIRPTLTPRSRVGSFRPNAFGLFDMHGTVQEWCLDWFAPYSALAVPDPHGPPHGERKILRGGSWFVQAAHCRSAYRNSFYPHSRSNNYGLRVVMTLAD
jgi:formylglycine-generating enzyme